MTSAFDDARRSRPGGGGDPLRRAESSGRAASSWGDHADDPAFKVLDHAEDARLRDSRRLNRSRSGERISSRVQLTDPEHLEGLPCGVIARASPPARWNGDTAERRYGVTQLRRTLQPRLNQ
jgi:hypothetical protein